MTVVIDGTNGVTAPGVTDTGNLSVAGTSTLTGSVGNITSSGTISVPTGALYPLVVGTALAATNNTSFDFTGIPSWVKRITVLFYNLSTNGTSLVQVQVGTSSGFTTSGYLSGAFSYNTGAGATSTTGFVVDQSVSAANTRYGAIVINTLLSNQWVSQGILQMTSTGSITPSTGGVTTGAQLDRIRITTVNGTDTFDSGAVNIQYE